MFKHPDRPGHLTVPHPRKDLGKGLVRKLLKQARLEIAAVGRGELRRR